MTTTTDDRITVRDIDGILATLAHAHTTRALDPVDSRIDDLALDLWRKGVDQFLDARLRMSP